MTSLLNKRYGVWNVVSGFADTLFAGALIGMIVAAAYAYFTGVPIRPSAQIGMLWGGAAGFVAAVFLVVYAHYMKPTDD